MDPKEKNLWIVIGLLAAGLIGYVAWTMRGTPPSSEAPIQEGTACTMDAKQCPDGTYVGRQGPNCEFAPCPGPSADIDVEVK